MASKQSLEMLKVIVQRIKDSHVFDRTLDKVKIVSAGEGKCVAEFTVEPEHQNLGGTLHGGFSATLVDCISTYALMTHGKQVPGVSVDIHVKYLKAATEGTEVVVESNLLKAGKRLAFLDVLIKNKKTGDLLVMGSHTKFIGS